MTGLVLATLPLACAPEPVSEEVAPLPEPTAERATALMAAAENAALDAAQPTRDPVRSRSATEEVNR